MHPRSAWEARFYYTALMFTMPVRSLFRLTVETIFSGCRLMCCNLVRTVCMVVALTSGAGQVLAALGGAPSAAPATPTATLASGVKRLAATTAAGDGLYTVQEVQHETGTRVLEYSNTAGIVFALVWRGPVLPDLSALLGEHFSTFKAEMEQARMLGKRGSPATVARDTLVLRSSGRMRNFSGYAYAPALIPAGVNINDVLQ